MKLYVFKANNFVTIVHNKWGKKMLVGGFFTSIYEYMKLVCLLVGCYLMPLGLDKNEPNLVWIFRFGMS